MSTMRSFHMDGGAYGPTAPGTDTARLMLRALRCAMLCIDMPTGIPRGVDCRAFLMLLAIGARRKMRVAPVHVDRPTVQEQHLIEVIAAAQAGDREGLDRLLVTLVVPAWHDPVRAAAIDLAGAMLDWAPPIPQTTTGTDRPVTGPGPTRLVHAGG